MGVALVFLGTSLWVCILQKSGERSECIYMCTCVCGVGYVRVCECMHYAVTATTLACLLTAWANSLVLNRLLHYCVCVGGCVWVCFVEEWGKGLNVNVYIQNTCYMCKTDY